MLVGALGRSSAANTVIPPSAWLLLVVLVPALVNALLVGVLGVAAWSRLRRFRATSG